MNHGIEPGSAKFFGRHKEYMQCASYKDYWFGDQGITILETQGIDFDALMLLTDSNVKTLLMTRGSRESRGCGLLPFATGLTAHFMLAQIFLIKPSKMAKVVMKDCCQFQECVQECVQVLGQTCNPGI
jgi:hypothetical protein